MQNIFSDIPEELPEEVIDSLVDSKHVRIKRLVSKGQSSPESGWYDQNENEWVILLKGEAVLVFKEGERLQLQPGDYVNIPARRQHRVEWTPADRETVWLAVHYPGRPS